MSDNMGFDPDKFVRDQLLNKKTMTIDKYRNDAVVIRTYKTNRKINPPSDHKVGKMPSRKSLNKLVFKLNNCDVPMTTMHTLTVHDRVAKFITPEIGKALLHASLQKLRRRRASQYVWVREFTKKGNVHWHIFSDYKTSAGDEVDKAESVRWSCWFSDRCRHVTGDMVGLEFAYRLMAEGNGKDFNGCVRVERLRDDAAGRYAGKEGAKRFQKMAPPGWEQAGRWWGASRSLVCTPHSRVQVRASSLLGAEVKTHDGKLLSVPFKNQFGRGKSKEIDEKNP